MATTRLIRSWGAINGAPQASLTSVKVVRCMSKAGGRFSSENGRLSGNEERKPVVVTKAAASTKAASLSNATQTRRGVDLAAMVVIMKAVVVRRLKIVTTPRPWSLIVQSFIHKVIIDTRFFTMFAVAGTLLGSVLCFLEGSFLVMESYLQYFHALSHHLDHGHIIQLLIEALDMFLVGTAMLIFGMGLHVMFVGSRSFKGKGSRLPSSNFFGLFYLKEYPSWAGMKSIGEGKTKIGHALMLLLQVGMLEKFKSVPLVTGLDLACFGGAVFVSSVGLFILSRLSHGFGYKAKA